MTINEYKANYKDFKCDLGDKLVMNIASRGAWGHLKGGQSEMLRICGDIPNTVPLEVYMKDPKKGELVASDAYMRCVQTAGLELKIEELIYKQFRKYDGYTTTPQRPLEKCLTKEDWLNHAPSIAGMISDICTHIQMSVSHADIDLGLEIEEIKNLSDGLMTEFTFYDSRGWKDHFVISWGMTPNALKQYHYDKVEPYWDPVNNRRRTKEEAEAYIKERAIREEAERKRKQPGYWDEYGLLIPQEYYQLRSGEFVPYDSLDANGKPIYILDKNDNKIWIQPEKREYSEQKRLNLEKEIIQYKKKYEAITNSDYPQQQKYRGIDHCLDRMQKLLDNGEDITEELDYLIDHFDFNELIAVIRNINNDNLNKLMEHYREPVFDDIEENNAGETSKYFEEDSARCSTSDNFEEDDDIEH